MTQDIRRIKDWKDVIDLDYPKADSTISLREQLSRYPQRMLGYCGARIAMGRIATQEDVDARRARAERLPL